MLRFASEMAERLGSRMDVGKMTLVTHCSKSLYENQSFNETTNRDLPVVLVK